MNVYILLDRTGSMISLWDEAVNSINHYISKLDHDTNIYLTLFDSDGYDVVYQYKAKNYIPFDKNEYKPRSMTNLYDACGKIMTQAELDNAEKCILVVMTDGYENCSKEYKLEHIKTKIKQWEDRKWEVVFLGANFDDVSKVSQSVGLNINKSINYSAGNFSRGMDILATKTNVYSKSSNSIVFSDDEKEQVKY